MAAKINGLGEITTNFLLNDFDVYIMNTSATGGYVSTDWTLLGFTGLEKNVNPIREKYRKEAKIPRVEVYNKTIRKGMELSYDLSNFNATLTAQILQGTSTSLGATGTEIEHGTSETSTAYRAMLFASELDDGRKYCIMIPKAETSINGEQTVGGETESVFPLITKAIYNPAGTTTKNLYSELYLAASKNATAVVPEAF